MKFLSTHVATGIVVTFLISSFFFIKTPAYAITSISGVTSATSSVGVALPLSDIQIVGNAASTTPIKLLVSNGTLSITNTGGLSSLSGTSGQTITFSGTVEDINTALETLTYTRGAVGTDTLEISLVGAGEVFFPDNGHLYEYISSAGDWNAAQAAAAALTRYGATGYLTTITSQAENNFAAERLTNAGWMGASDAAVEGEWRWVTGPETGTQFWSGDETGSTVGGNYENWAPSEPNDFPPSGEDCAQFLAGGSGEWNDLPCSGTSLPGFVVEFGAPGDMPTVLARNISLVTVNAPTVIDFTPNDNATNSNGADDLVINFSEAVTVATGTVRLFRTSDNALIETIPVISSQVTGGGTDEITINPAVVLADNTGYYVQISATAFENDSNVFYQGINNSTSWNFTTGDFTGPTFNTIQATPGTAEVSITWNTNEAASSKVVFGVDSIITDATSEINTSPRVTSHSITLPNLSRCTRYLYQLVGRDAAGNSATSTIQSITTEGCSSGGGSRPASRTVVKDEVLPTETIPQNKTLQELKDANELADALDLILRDTSVIIREPKLVVEILQAYLAQVQSGAIQISSPITVRDLYVGLEGEDVRRLQTLLIEEAAGPAAAELARVTATGYFSNYTYNALVEYQSKYNIVPASGYFGSITRAQMKQTNIPGLWW